MKQRSTFISIRSASMTPVGCCGAAARRAAHAQGVCRPPRFWSPAPANWSARRCCSRRSGRIRLSATACSRPASARSAKCWTTIRSSRTTSKPRIAGVSLRRRRPSGGQRPRARSAAGPWRRATPAGNAVKPGFRPGASHAAVALPAPAVAAIAAIPRIRTVLHSTGPLRPQRRRQHCLSGSRRRSARSGVRDGLGVAHRVFLAGAGVREVSHAGSPPSPG